MKVKLIGMILLLVLNSNLACRQNKIETKEILIEVLSNAQFRQYLHPNEKSRDILYFVANSFTESLVDFKEHDISIIIRKEKDIKSLNVIKINEMKVDNQLCKLSFYYKPENIDVQVQLKRVDKWKITTLEIIEL